jgi:VanZ family protein
MSAALTTYLELPRGCRWALALAIMLLLWYASSGPVPLRVDSRIGSIAHNGMHVVAYAALGASFHLASVRGPSDLAAGVQAGWPWSSLSVTAVYGVIDELHQSFVPGRVSSLADAVSDLGGAALGITATSLVLAGRAARPMPALGWLASVVGVSAASLS